MGNCEGKEGVPGEKDQIVPDLDALNLQPRERDAELDQQGNISKNDSVTNISRDLKNNENAEGNNSINGNDGTVRQAENKSGFVIYKPESGGKDKNQEQKGKDDQNKETGKTREKKNGKDVREYLLYKCIGSLSILFPKLYMGSNVLMLIIIIIMTGTERVLNVYMFYTLHTTKYVLLHTSNI